MEIIYSHAIYVFRQFENTDLFTSGDLDFDPRQRMTEVVLEYFLTSFLEPFFFLL